VDQAIAAQNAVLVQDEQLVPTPHGLLHQGVGGVLGGLDVVEGIEDES
jgi:hypothetical protein